MLWAAEEGVASGCAGRDGGQHVCGSSYVHTHKQQRWCDSDSDSGSKQQERDGNTNTHDADKVGTTDAFRVVRERAS